MKTFLTIILILFLLRILLKPFIKFTVYSTVNRMAEEARKEQQRYVDSQRKKEGTISVDYIPDKNKGKKKKNDDGDYVDFEEV